VSRSCAQNAAKAPESDYSKRIAQLERYSGLDQCYPRITKADGVKRVSVENLRDMAAKLASQESGAQEIRVIGRQIDNMIMLQPTECARQSACSPFRWIEACVS